MFLLKKSVKLIIFSLICTFSGVYCYAQSEPQFAAAYAIPTALNPAAAGRAGQFEATAAFRKQWLGFTDEPSNLLLTIDKEIALLKNFHGVGAVVLQDKAGPPTMLDMALNYSYHIYLADGLLGLGLRLGARNVKYDASSLYTAVSGLSDDYHQESDQAITSLDDSQTAFDVGLGAFYQTQRSFVSLAFLHLTSPELEFKNGALFKVRPVVTLSSGILLGHNIKDKAFEPRLSMRSDFASLQLDMTLNVNIRQKVWFGLGYRLQDALLIGAGLRLPIGLDIAYNYDLSLSSLKRYNTGAHEVVLRYLFDLDTQRATKNYKSVRIL